MLVPAGQTDVTTYFHLRLAADGTDATGLTITNIDLQYVRSRTAPVAKVDATALAATDSAHGDNQAIEIDSADQPGVYRVDWPDAAFAAGVDEVILTVKCATAFTESLRVRLMSATRGLAGTALPNAAADAAGGLPISDAGGLDLDAQIGTDIDAILVDTGTTLQGELDGIQADTEDIQSRLPAALTGDGNIKADTLRIGGTLQTANDVGADVNDILADTAVIGTPSDLGSGATVAGNLVDIEGQTDDIGVAGAGLTNINLPDQTMNITGNITGNLSGSVGSVSGAVGSVTAGVTLANDAITAAKFDESTAFPLASADTGSTQVARTGADADTLETLSDQLDAKASQASVDDLPTNAELATALGTADDAVLAQVALVKAKTDNLPVSPAATGDIAAALEATIADSIPADGDRPSIKQALYILTQYLLERSVSGTTVTVKKPDGSTTLLTLTLDSATTPTSTTRAT